MGIQVGGYSFKTLFRLLHCQIQVPIHNLVSNIIIIRRQTLQHARTWHRRIVRGTHAQREFRRDFSKSLFTFHLCHRSSPHSKYSGVLHRGIA